MDPPEMANKPETTSNHTMHLKVFPLITKIDINTRARKLFMYLLTNTSYHNAIFTRISM